MILKRIPRLEYPLTRPFDSQWLSAIAYTIGFVSIVVLSIANVALVGYDTVSGFRSNFNSTEKYWFDAFTPSFASRSKPGKQCDAHVFDVGDSLITNSSLFDWSVNAVVKANAGESGFSYKGETLDNCDVIEINLFGDLNTWTVEGQVFMYCEPLAGTDGGTGGLVVLGGMAKFGVSALAAKQTDFQRLAKNAAHRSIMFTLGDIFSLAAIDIGSQFYSDYVASNGTGLISYSLVAKFEHCPPSYAHEARCIASRTQPPAVNITSVSGVSNNHSLLQDSSFAAPGTLQLELEESLRSPTLNFLQLARAAAQIDIGNAAPNNFLTNLSMVDSVLIPTYPSASRPGVSMKSQLYNAWKSQLMQSTIEPKPYANLGISGPSTLQAVFICHFSRLKSTGSLLVSVLVATLTHIVKTRIGSEANTCQGHQGGKVTADIESGKFNEEGELERAEDGKTEEYGSSISIPNPDSAEAKREPLLHRKSRGLTL
ncbi:hypothetical protein D9611_001482 [Ephemerocybe angulata]|uniref:Uncharacterized protein n=1 Tax=Ephemerocybe angulata TaxID=980116 RepID=A0A8H5CIV0_9AGAR|nr:hypothetical protein D9611_001482 [Tulosesus angulatus]